MSDTATDPTAGGERPAGRLRRLARGVRRANRTRRPEDSVPLRVSVLAAVLVAVLAAWQSGAAPSGDALLAVVLLPVGAVVSYRRRDCDNLLIKVALTLGAILALQRFFGDLRVATSIEDTRAPLAGLFLAVQVLHGFDLPQRRDLGFTLASSLTLVALAAVNTHAGTFGALLVAYLLLAGAALRHIQRSGARQRADEWAEREQLAALQPAPAARARPAGTEAGRLRRTGATAWASVRTAAPVLIVGALVFGLLPRAGSQQFGGLPFEGFPGASLPDAGISNPGLEGGGQQTPDGGGSPAVSFNPTAYFGFAQYVDLRTVGELADDPILRVRADRPQFWRGIVFDTYDGTGWTRTESDPPPATHGRPVRLASSHGPLAETERVVQTFELLDDTPNLIFAAGDPVEVHLAGRSVNRWSDGTLTTSQLQEEGTIYSVVSEVLTSSPGELRRATDARAAAQGVEGTPSALRERYTQLPASLPSRVHDLAARLTADAETNYAKAEAVEAWIGANTEYTLGAPAPPEQRDVVDHFLFDTRRGWCEPIASSMTVLLRSAGVPARFVSGFQPGDFNPISGVFDVRTDMAHTWVEVWAPGYGWVDFDPTGAVPQAVDGSEVPTLPLVEAGGWVTERLGALVPEPVRGAAVGTARAVAERPAATGLALLGVVAAGGGALAWRRRRRRWVPATPFEELEALLTVHGIPRDAWQTPREYLRRIRLHRPDLPEDALAALLAAEEARRYVPAGAPTGGGPRTDEAAALTALREHLARAEQAPGALTVPRR